MIENRLGIFGTVFLLIGLFLLVWLLYIVIRGKTERTSSARFKRFLERTAGKVIIFVVALIFLSLAQFFFWAQSSLKTYFLYFPDKLIAQLKLQEDPESHRFLLTSTLFGDKGEKFTETFLLTEKKLKLESQVLLFDSFFRGFGFVSKYKINKIESRSASSDVSVSFDIAGGSDSFWEGMAKIGKIIPFVKTKKLETEYIPLELDKPVKVFIEKNRLKVE